MEMLGSIIKRWNSDKRDEVFKRVSTYDYNSLLICEKP